jgi:hypothetical protein
MSVPLSHRRATRAAVPIAAAALCVLGTGVASAHLTTDPSDLSRRGRQRQDRSASEDRQHHPHRVRPDHHLDSRPRKRCCARPIRLFQILTGTIPDTGDTLIIPATETYSDGTVVNWDQPPATGGAEVEYPAPVITLTGTSTSGHGSGDAVEFWNPTGVDADVVTLPLARFTVTGPASSVGEGP